MSDSLKLAAAEASLEEVEDGMVLGLGTGSTAALMIEVLGRRVQQGLQVVGIPTSERSAAQASAVGIPLVDFSTHPRIDLTIDGADEVDPALNLIKGLGGALLREKIVAAASRRMTVIVDAGKLVPRLGGVRLPVEVVAFGWQATAVRLRAAGADTVLRHGADGVAFRTDSGNLILDCAFACIDDAAALAVQLKAMIGVVESGLFIGLATTVIVGTPTGLKKLERA